MTENACRLERRAQRLEIRQRKARLLAGQMHRVTLPPRLARGVIGNTADFGSAFSGSSPDGPANFALRASLAKGAMVLAAKHALKRSTPRQSGACFVLVLSERRRSNGLHSLGPGPSWQQPRQCQRGYQCSRVHEYGALVRGYVPGVRDLRAEHRNANDSADVTHG